MPSMSDSSDVVPDVAGRDLDRAFAQPEREFRFDESVVDRFDDMLERSIPGYVEMRRIVAELAKLHVRSYGLVLDLGCSRGEALATVLDGAPAGARGVGVEVSPPMRAAAQARGFEVLDVDLRRDFPDVRDVDVVLAVLTLQFVPIEHRQRLVSRARASLREGGVMFVVEKVLAGDPATDAELVAAHNTRKRALGYSDEEIDRNLLALEGVLVPVPAAWNEDLLRRSGFSRVECVWRSLNFAGWIAGN